MQQIVAIGDRVYAMRREGDAVLLRRIDTGSEYRLTQNHAGRWSCNCPACRWGQKTCKHIKEMEGRAMADESNPAGGTHQIARALVAARAELQNPAYDKVNPHYKSRYASLAAVQDAVLPVLAKHGLAVVQTLGTAQRGPTITTILLHVSGQQIVSGPLEMPATKQDAQGWGSAITYGRRYALQAIAGVVGDDEDDDGQAASSRPAQESRPAPQRQPQPQPAPAKTQEQSPAQTETRKRPMRDRIGNYEAKLVHNGICSPGELVGWLVDSLGAAWCDCPEEDVAREVKAFEEAPVAQ